MLPVETRQLPKSGADALNVAYAAPRTAVAQRPTHPPRGRHWNLPVDRVVALYLAGETAKSIADRFARSKSTILRVLDGADIQRRGRGKPALTDHDRFLSKVRMTDTCCWWWEGYRQRDGYGQIRGRAVDGTRRPVPAHRFAYELFRGPIPPNYEVDHNCRNRACVNPEHLQLSTRAENMALAGADRRWCSDGHPPIPDAVWFRHLRRFMGTCPGCGQSAQAGWQDGAEPVAAVEVGE